MTFSTLLVADHGETAARAVRAARALGLRTVAVSGDAGPGPLAEETVPFGAGSRGAVERVLRAARETGADAVLPGRGPLTADAEFARRCEEAGIVFVGPAPDQLEVFGDRCTARAAAGAAGLPLAPGTELLTSWEEALEEAGRLGLPVVLKAAAGGSAVCRSGAELASAWRRARRAGAAPGRVFLERLVAPARHVEVPVFGDGEGLVVTFGDRDGSLGRRGRRLLTESPAPRLPDHVRAQLTAAARDLCSWVEYRSAGTVEFVYDTAREEAYFLEVDTRPRAEHAVTEEVHGVDLVAWALRLALGERGVVRAPGPPLGHAVAAFLGTDAEADTDTDADTDVDGDADSYAGTGADADAGVDAGADTDAPPGPFGSGLPESARAGSGRTACGPPGSGRATTSDRVTITRPYAMSPVQVIVRGADRDEALARLGTALDGIGPAGGAPSGALGLVRAALTDPAFRAATHSTTTLESRDRAPEHGGGPADHPTDE